MARITAPVGEAMSAPPGPSPRRARSSTAIRMARSNIPACRRSDSSSAAIRAAARRRSLSGGRPICPTAIRHQPSSGGWAAL
jgi:hypothetical protein